MRNVSFALLLLLLTVLLRSPALPWKALEEDEACHFTGAVAIAEGGKPYEVIADGKTPLLWYLFAFVVKIAGPFNTLAHRLFTDFNVWLTALLLWWLGRLFGKPDAGSWAALLFTLFSTCSSYKILASNYELHFLPFDVLAYCFFALTITRKQPLWAFVSGAAIATSFFIKQTAGISLAAQGVFCLLLFVSIPQQRKLAISTASTLIAGFIFATVGYVVWMWKLGVLNAMLFWTWDYAWILTKESAAALPFWSRFAGRAGSWIAGTAIVHFWAACFLWHALRPSTIKNENWIAALLFLWGAGEWVAIPLGGRFPPHYFLMYLPPLCLMAGMWVGTTASVGHFFLAKASLKRWGQRFAYFVFPLSVSFIASWNVAWGNQLFHLKRADHAQLAKRIQLETTPQDRIFVWGHNPEFYVFSKRRAASRFVFVDFLTGRHGIPSSNVTNVAAYDAMVIPGAWSLLFEDFAQHPPQLIIDTSPADLHDYNVFPISHYPQLAEYLAHSYHLGWVEDDVRFYIRNKPPLNDR